MKKKVLHLSVKKQWFDFCWRKDRGVSGNKTILD